jgi:hypothetical protein
MNTAGGVSAAAAGRKTDTSTLQHEMDEAAKRFSKEFRALLESFEIEEAQAVSRLIDLIHKYRGSAGYKRICREMLSEKDMA